LNAIEFALTGRTRRAMSTCRRLHRRTDRTTY
jgi:hypothetical protein